MQSLQHQAITPQGDDNVGIVRIRIAVSLFELRMGGACLRCLTGYEGNVPMTWGWPIHGDLDPMERAVLVYTTWPSIVEAERAGAAIVGRRLAACVNILPGMISHYWWEGKIERAEETVTIFKTRASLAEAVRAAVKDMHRYTTPSVIVLPVESVDADYYAWILRETSG